MMLPSVNSTTSAPGNLIYISWLNGWPVNTPVNASPHTSRYATHDSGTLWIAGPSMVGGLSPLDLYRSPGAHCFFITSIVTLFFSNPGRT
uniref:Error-prone repair protein UmuD n=1 Tax=Klebsiella pneumoniae TaxID=573 RepID=A0A8B0STD1_KLEPN|nr:Error-prone repair protein UmuD [Klebsiella pneumoniae]